ncbi:MAG: hypothetical protein A3F54_02765 [Candidatus Kerfeldbacteria bacterium RIFCSPHIGHO2_12_FULL_48_17]|uniref:dihydrofolate reductase n=1 Tax=Candidatus Kerfeldbacteria bacterium RIFCSPHIGHO2_12_FULL_48_17 TaxID=1798542 RepID=A0A1G2B3P1_9BACT|nr:MAG: hypothetical protein A3F54_02765 [Candidatus Kerfeldbacteria bacterium RIFCSPHIGHO2_12_FULL_48_17]
MYKNHRIFLIAAMLYPSRGIGFKGDLPWRKAGVGSLKEDMRFFHDTTMAVADKVADVEKQNMVIMGRNTWNSIPSKHRKLADRKNVVITHKVDLVEEPKKIDAIVTSYEDALAAANESVADIFVIGGAMVYDYALKHPATDGVYLTQVTADFPCDTFFPALPAIFSSQPKKLDSGEQGGIRYEFLLFTRQHSL